MADKDDDKQDSNKYRAQVMQPDKKNRPYLGLIMLGIIIVMGLMIACLVLSVMAVKKSSSEEQDLTDLTTQVESIAKYMEEEATASAELDALCKEVKQEIARLTTERHVVDMEMGMLLGEFEGRATEKLVSIIKNDELSQKMKEQSSEVEILRVASEKTQDKILNLTDIATMSKGKLKNLNNLSVDLLDQMAKQTSASVELSELNTKVKADVKSLSEEGKVADEKMGRMLADLAKRNDELSNKIAEQTPVLENLRLAMKLTNDKLANGTDMAMMSTEKLNDLTDLSMELLRQMAHETAAFQALSDLCTKVKGDIARLTEERKAADENMAQMTKQTGEKLAGLKTRNDELLQMMGDQLPTVANLQSSSDDANEKLTNLTAMSEMSKVQLKGIGDLSIELLQNIGKQKAASDQLDELCKQVKQDIALLTEQLKAKDGHKIGTLAAIAQRNMQMLQVMEVQTPVVLELESASKTRNDIVSNLTASETMNKQKLTPLIDLSRELLQQVTKQSAASDALSVLCTEVKQLIEQTKEQLTNLKKDNNVSDSMIADIEMLSNSTDKLTVAAQMISTQFAYVFGGKGVFLQHMENQTSATDKLSATFSETKGNLLNLTGLNGPIVQLMERHTVAAGSLSNSITSLEMESTMANDKVGSITQRNEVLVQEMAKQTTVVSEAINVAKEQTTYLTNTVTASGEQIAKIQKVNDVFQQYMVNATVATENLISSTSDVLVASAGLTSSTVGAVKDQSGELLKSAARQGAVVGNISTATDELKTAASTAYGILMNLTNRHDELSDFIMKPVCTGSWSAHDGRCFQFFQCSCTATTAQNECARHGGLLAEVKSQEDNDFIRARLPNRKIWIGLDDKVTEGMWIGSRGNATNYANWAQDQPSNGVDKDCVYMGTPLSGDSTWGDYSCTLPHDDAGYACEKK